MKKIKNPLLLLALGATALCGLAAIKIQPKEFNSVNAEIPSGYYSACEGLSGSSLQSKLLDINKPKSKSYDWSRYEAADEALDDSTSILSLYTRHNIKKNGHCGSYSWSTWNREHIWTQSKYPASDTDNHNIFACEGQINNYRGNLPFNEVEHTSDNTKLVFGHDTGCYWTKSYFEPCDEAKGEVARSVMYGTVMYSYNMTEEIKSMDLALKWHLEHPITERDTRRNDIVYGLQGNRNPFVDHRSYACKIWGNSSNSAKAVCDQYNGWVDGDEPTPETKTLEKIELSGTATTKSYYVGDAFDISGLTVTATFDDNGTKSTSDVTGSVKIEPTTLSLDTKYVTFSYTYNGTTKTTTYNNFTVSERPATNYGTLDNPLSVSEAKALIGDECSTSGSYTKQPIFCKAKVGTIISSDSANLRKKIYAKDLVSASSIVTVESLNMASSQDYNNLETDDEIIFHGYGCNNGGTHQFKYKNNYEVALDRNITKEAIVPVDSVKITNTKTDYYIGDTCQINATVLPSNASNKSLTYSSNNTNVATVNNAGEVSFKTAGSVTITASSNNNKTGTITFNVTKRPVPVESIEATLSSTSYYVGETASIIYRVLPTDADNPDVSFASSDTQVATINDEGEVRFLKEGPVTISVISDENTSIRNDINVTVSTRPVEDILIREIIVDDSLSLNVGDNEQISYQIVPSDATDKKVNWSSSNSAVASVDEEGYVTGVAEGNAVVTVTANDAGHVSNTVNVQVTKPVHIVEVSEIKVPSNISINVGEEIDIEYEVLPENATDKSVTWSSNNESIATVVDGKVTGVSEGNTRIVVYANDDSHVSNVINVEVKKPVHIVEVSEIKVPSNVSVNVGEEFNISYEVLPENATDKSVSWSSNDESIATVVNGKVTGVSEGNTRIVVSANDDSHVSNVINVEVKKPVQIIEVSEIKVPSNISVKIGEEFNISYEVLPENTTDKSVSWSSNDESIATVVDGKVTGVSEGNTRIVVSANDDSHVSNVINVEVTKSEQPVVKPVAEISVVKLPNKTNYQIGETFDSTGLVVNANYIDGTENQISNFNLSNIDTSVAGVKPVEVTYVASDKTYKTSFNVIVLEASVISIKIQETPAKMNYFADEQLNTYGLKISATMSNNTIVQDVSNMCEYVYDFANSNKVQVSFSGASTSFYVTVEKNVSEKPVQHKAADFAYVFVEKFESKEPASVNQSEWDALQYYYNKLDTASKEFLKNYKVSSGNGEVSAEVPEVDALKQFANKYDAIYSAHKAEGFVDFIGRASVQPIPGPTPTPTPSSDNKTLIIVIVVICVVAVAIIAIIIPVEIKRSRKGKKNA